jgi:hypothetical protein
VLWTTRTPGDVNQNFLFECHSAFTVYFQTEIRVSGWLSDLFFGEGSEADRVQERAFPLLAAETGSSARSRLSGLDLPSGDIQISRSSIGRCRNVDSFEGTPATANDWPTRRASRSLAGINLPCESKSTTYAQRDPQFRPNDRHRTGRLLAA